MDVGVSNSILGSGEEQMDENSASSSDSNAGAALSQNVASVSRVKCSCNNDKTESSSSSNSSSYEGLSHSEPAYSISSATLSNQSPKCCLQQRCGSALNNNYLSDVTFIVGKGLQKQKIRAHRLILAIGSDVFKAMFSERWSPESSEVEIPDVEPPAFSILLRYLYTDEILITSETVAATFYAAKKYGLLLLEKGCMKYLIENLCAENAFAVLTLARSFDEQKLMELCLKVIDEDTDVAISAPDFVDVDSESLRMVLKRDSLTIKEVDLFNAIVRWSSAECARLRLPLSQENRQSVVKKLVPLIRFPLIPTEEILSTLIQANIFTEEELMSMFRYFFLNSKPPIIFNSTPRFLDKFTVCRFQTAKQEFVYPRTGAEYIEFQVDCKVRLLGVGLYGPVKPGQYSIDIDLNDASSLKRIHTESCVKTFDLATLKFEILFKNPVKLVPGMDYEVISTIKGPPSFYGGQSVQKVTKTLSHARTVTITFATTRRTQTARTNVNSGQIPELIFST